VFERVAVLGVFGLLASSMVSTWLKYQKNISKWIENKLRIDNIQAGSNLGLNHQTHTTPDARG
jgi:hypothetical protein